MEKAVQRPGDGEGIGNIGENSSRGDNKALIARDTIRATLDETTRELDIKTIENESLRAD